MLSGACANNIQAMKRMIIFLPVLLFILSAPAVIFFANEHYWVLPPFGCLFISSLFAVPFISRKSVAAGCVATGLIITTLIFTLLSGMGWDRPGRGPNAAELFVTQAIIPLMEFRVHTGRYPTTEEGLQALIQCPPGMESKWKGPYIKTDRIPLDPWRHEYQYRHPGAHDSKEPDIWSLGPDGIASADDIGNWQWR
jgi:general secretion pathway protein G